MDAMETAIIASPTHDQTRMEIDRHLATVVVLLEAQRSGEKKEQSSFSFREAQSHKPQKWSGRKDKIDFIEFSNSLKNWADTLHDEGVELMEEYEGQAQPVEEDDLDTNNHEDIEKFSKALYTELIDCLTGEALKFVLNKKRGHGIAAWR